MGPETLPGAMRDEVIYEAEEYGEVVPLAPHLLAQLEQAETEIQAAANEMAQAVYDTLALAQSEIDQTAGEFNLILETALGVIDQETRAAATSMASAIERTLATAQREVIHAQEEMIAYGTPIPRMVELQRMILDDPDPMPLLSVVLGDFTDGSAQPIPHDPTGTGPLASGDTVPSALDSGYVNALVSLVPDGSSGPVAEAPQAQPVAIDSAPVAPAVPTHCDCPAPIVNVTCAPPATTSKSAEPVPPPVPPVPPVAPEQPMEFFDAFAGLAPAAPIGDMVRAAPPFVPVALDRREGLRWDMVTVCSDADTALKSYKGANARGLLDPATTLDSISGLYRQIRAGFFSALDTIGDIGNAERDKHKQDAERAYYETTGDILGGLSAVAETLNRVDSTALPDRATTWNLGLILASAKKAESDSQFPLSYAVASLEYLYHYSAPQYIPGQPTLDAALLSDQLSWERWRCLTRAHGNIPSLHEMGVWAGAVRPGIHDLVSLHQRGKLTRDELTVRARAIGVLDPAKVDEYIANAQFIPSAPDIMRFVKKDVFDAKVVENGRLDEGFIESFYGRGGKEAPGPAVQWARAWGLSDEVFLYDYRASWEFPSNTAVYEMIHRYRPGRKAVRDWEAERDRAIQRGIDPDEFAKKNPPPQVFTLDDARAVFKINDIAPAYVERLVGISYNPITRTDCLQAFHANAMDEVELADRLQDTGLNVSDALRVVEIQKFQKARREANVSGVWSVRKIAKGYKEGALLAPAADQLLAPLIPDAQQRFNLLTGVDREIEADERRAQLDMIRRQHLTGEVDDAKIEDRLKLMRFPQARIDQFMSTWGSKRRGRLKEPSAAMVQTWVKRGIVTAEEGLTRIIRIGYSNTDATRIINAALQEGQERIEVRMRQARNDLKAIINDQRKAARSANKELEDAEKEALQVIARRQKELETIRKEMATRVP